MLPVFEAAVVWAGSILFDTSKTISTLADLTHEPAGI